LPERLHRPVLELLEALENKIQKLILGNTGSLEDLALLGLVLLSSLLLK
jgi:hypothetical protein